ncbi:MAG: ATP-dependent dethiobiotin synthetase BioD [Hyphomicrobiaceae bacterium]|nr:MAG: ATP-dependent dethiobiotin synthetase BioD [Hyphomicrobiaceae bacterium]
MSPRFIVTGTDTGVGKTVFSAALVGALACRYWKPIQSGLDAESDSELVRRLSGAPHEHILPEAWRLKTPVSPHLAAEIDGVGVDPGALVPPPCPDPLVIEGVGGLMVPLTRQHLFLDLIERWQIPVILCARTTLGTINHSLLSIDALRRRAIPLHGIVFIGPHNADNERVIVEMSGVRRLGWLPLLVPLTRDTLRQAFAHNFHRSDFLPGEAAA